MVKIIILQNIPNLGEVGDIIDVKSGYARNFLIPFNKALYASDVNVKKFSKELLLYKESLSSRLLKNKTLLDNLNKLSPLKILCRHKKDGRLFGSIKSVDISNVIYERLKVRISRKLIVLPDSKVISYLGEYVISICLDKKNVVSIILKLLSGNT